MHKRTLAFFIFHSTRILNHLTELSQYAKAYQLIIKSRLLILYAQLIIHGSDDALNLAHGKHAAQEGITGIVAMVALIKHTTWLIGEGHAMIYSHRQSATRIALAFLLCLLEDAAKLYQMATTTQVRSLGEVTVREDVAGTKVNEMGAVGKLLCHSYTVVVLTGRE